MKGLPLNVPLALLSVTPDGRPVRTIWNGPERVVEPVLVTVMVPEKVFETRE